jgi:hypothetical protein
MDFNAPVTLPTAADEAGEPPPQLLQAPGQPPELGKSGLAYVPAPLLPAGRFEAMTVGDVFGKIMFTV